jgi:transposase
MPATAASSAGWSLLLAAAAGLFDQPDRMVEAGLAGLLAATLGWGGGRAEQRIQVVMVDAGHGRSMPPPPSACRATTPDEDPMPAAPAQHPTRPTRRFPTDLTDAQWCLLAPLLPTPRSGPGRPGRPATSRRALVDAILYVLWTGCPWRALPDGYPHWRTVHHHFARWATDGTLARLHDVLRSRMRVAAGRTQAPTAAGDRLAVGPGQRLGLTGDQGL